MKNKKTGTAQNPGTTTQESIIENYPYCCSKGSKLFEIPLQGCSRVSKAWKVPGALAGRFQNRLKVPCNLQEGIVREHRSPATCGTELLVTVKLVPVNERIHFRVNINY